MGLESSRKEFEAMAQSDNVRKGVDTKIVQATLVRGPDTEFQEKLRSCDIIVRGGHTKLVNDTLDTNLIFEPGGDLNAGDILSPSSIKVRKKSHSPTDTFFVFQEDEDKDKVPIGFQFGFYGHLSDPQDVVFGDEGSLFVGKAPKTSPITHCYRVRLLSGGYTPSDPVTIVINGTDLQPAAVPNYVGPTVFWDASAVGDTAADLAELALSINDPTSLLFINFVATTFIDVGAEIFELIVCSKTTNTTFTLTDPNSETFSITPFTTGGTILPGDPIAGLWLKTTVNTFSNGWERLAFLSEAREDLEATLLIGNTTGSTPIAISQGSGIQGEPEVSYTVKAGDALGPTNDSGTLTITSGLLGASTGNAGAVNIVGVQSAGGPGGGAGGDVNISGGFSGGTFKGGSLTLTGGVGGVTGGSGGSVDVLTGPAIVGNGGDFTVLTGVGSSLSGAIILRTGDGSITSGKTGSIRLITGDPAATATTGGEIELKIGGPATTIKGGNITLSAGVSTSDEGGDIVMNPGIGGTTDGAVIVNGKLTVTGLIDPIGMVFSENAGDSEVPVGPNEGGIYVSDGSAGRLNNGLYFKAASGLHHLIEPKGGDSVGLANSFPNAQWGMICAPANFSDSEKFFDETGLLWKDEATIASRYSTNGALIVNQTAVFRIADEGVVYTFFSGDPGNWVGYSQPTEITRDIKFSAVFKFSVEETTSSTSREFIGFSLDIIQEIVATTDTPDVDYFGLFRRTASPRYSLVSKSGATNSQTFFDLAADSVYYLEILSNGDGDPEPLVLRVLDSDLVELHRFVPNASSLIDQTQEFLLQIGLFSTVDYNTTNHRLGIFFGTVVPQYKSVSTGGGTGSLQDLTSVLAIGNTTGGNDILFTSGDNIVGVVGTGAVGPGDLSISPGASINASFPGGTLNLTSGDQTATGGVSGDFNILTASVSSGSASSGDLSIKTGDSLTASGSTGNLIFASGVPSAGVSGNISFTTANGTTGGDIDFLAGLSSASATQGGSLSLFAGASGTNATGGVVEIRGGDASGIGDGGSITLRPGLATGSGTDGVVFIPGKLTVTGIIDPTGMVFDHQASTPEGSPASGKTTMWVRSDGIPFITDSGGTDTSLLGGGGATDLNSLTDVTISSPSVNEILEFNGSVWVNVPATGGAPTPTWADTLLAGAFTGPTDLTLSGPFERTIQGESVVGGDGVHVTIVAGSSTVTGDGGNLTIIGGDADVTGGDVVILGGAGGTGDGGNIIMTPGAGSTNGVTVVNSELFVATFVDAIASRLVYQATIPTLPAVTRGVLWADTPAEDLFFSTDSITHNLTTRTVDDLSDTTLSTLNPNDVLTWDGAKWINAAVPGGGGPHGLTDHTDVILTSPVLNNYFIFDGTDWRNQVPLLPQMGDVTITSPASNEVLTFNGFTWVNAAVPGGGGPLQLADLTDVNSSVSTPATNEFFIYDGAEWTNTVPNIELLNNVTITSPANTEVLTFNGTIWVNLPATGGGADELNDLTDVTLTGPVADEILLFNGSQWVNGPVPGIGSTDLGELFTRMQWGFVTSTDSAFYSKSGLLNDLLEFGLGGSNTYGVDNFGPFLNFLGPVASPSPVPNGWYTQDLITRTFVNPLVIFRFSGSATSGNDMRFFCGLTDDTIQTMLDNVNPTTSTFIGVRLFGDQPSGLTFQFVTWPGIGGPSITAINSSINFVPGTEYVISIKHVGIPGNSRYFIDFRDPNDYNTILDHEELQLVQGTPPASADLGVMWGFQSSSVSNTEQLKFRAANILNFSDRFDSIAIGGDGGGAPIDAQYVVVNLNGILTDERVLTGGTALSLTDGGANNNITIDLDNTAVTPGSFTNANITVDAQGRLTAASNGSAIPLDLGDLNDVVLTAPTTEHFLKFDGVNWINAPAPGGNGTGDPFTFSGNFALLQWGTLDPTVSPWFHGAGFTHDFSFDFSTGVNFTVDDRGPVTEASTALTGDNVGLRSFSQVTTLDFEPIAAFYFRTGDLGTTNLRFFCVLSTANVFNDQMGSSSPFEDYVGVRYNSPTDSEFKFVVDNGNGSPTVVSTGINYSVSTDYVVVISSRNSTGTVGTTVFFLDPDDLGTILSEHTFALTGGNSPSRTAPMGNLCAVRQLSVGVFHKLGIRKMSIVNNHVEFDETVGGATDPLSSILAVGNTTGPNDIVLSGGAALSSLDGTGSGNADPLFIQTGAGGASGGDSGDLAISTQDAPANGDAGDITISGGDGNVSGGGGQGGSVAVTPGDGTGTSDAGNLVLDSGTALGTGNDGTIFINGAINPDGSAYKHGNNVVSLTTNPVVFTTPFGSTPTNIKITIIATSQPPNVNWVSNLSSTGFNVNFDTVPPGGTVVHWTVIL